MLRFTFIHQLGIKIVGTFSLSFLLFLITYLQIYKDGVTFLFLFESRVIKYLIWTYFKNEGLL